MCGMGKWMIRKKGEIKDGLFDFDCCGGYFRFTLLSWHKNDAYF